MASISVPRPALAFRSLHFMRHLSVGERRLKGCNLAGPNVSGIASCVKGGYGHVQSWARPRMDTELLRTRISVKSKRPCHYVFLCFFFHLNKKEHELECHISIIPVQ